MTVRIWLSGNAFFLIITHGVRVVGISKMFSFKFLYEYMNIASSVCFFICLFVCSITNKKDGYRQRNARQFL